MNDFSRIHMFQCTQHMLNERMQTAYIWAIHHAHIYSMVKLGVSLSFPINYTLCITQSSYPISVHYELKEWVENAPKFHQTLCLFTFSTKKSSKQNKITRFDFLFLLRLSVIPFYYLHSFRKFLWKKKQFSSFNCVVIYFFCLKQTKKTSVKCFKKFFAN